MTINMLSSEWLEALNGFTFVQSVQLCLLFGFFLWRFREDYGKPYYNLVAAIATYHTGASLGWGWRWLWRWLGNHGYTQAADWMAYWPVPLIGAAIMCVGLLCKIRVVTFAGWGNWPWVLSFWISLLFVAVTTWL